MVTACCAMACNVVARLTPKQHRFINAYLESGDAQAAAIKAGFSARSAQVTGWRLLNRTPEVQEEVAARQKAAADRADIHLEEVLRELGRIGLSDIGQVVDAQGQPLPLDKMSEDARRAVSGIEVEERLGEPRPTDDGGTMHVGGSRRVKVRLWDKVAALKELRAHCEPSKLRLEGEGGGPLSIVIHKET